MATIQLIVFGTTPPCARCKRAEQEALKAAAQFPGQVEVRKLDILGPEADAYGMITSPAIVINDQVVASGRIVAANDLTRHIRTILGG